MPWSCRSERHSPWAVMPAAGNVAQACFQSRVFPLPVTLPPEKVISSGLALSSRGAIRSISKSLALIAASFTEGDNDAEVVEPPDGLAPPSFELPIRSITSLSCRPNSSATIARVYVRVPVPRSCVPTATPTEPSGEIVRSTLHWLLPPPPQVPTAQPIPRLSGPAPPPGVGFFFAQPISLAPRSS